MAKRCVICKQKLSENLFTSHPLKCDECWTKELKETPKDQGMDETTSTSYMKPLQKTVKPKKKDSGVMGTTEDPIKEVRHTSMKLTDEEIKFFAEKKKEDDVNKL